MAICISEVAPTTISQRGARLRKFGLLFVFSFWFIHAASFAQADTSALTGIWTSNIGVVYEITQSGDDFSWFAPQLRQKGVGQVTGPAAIKVTWKDERGALKRANGLIKKHDSEGHAIRIEWDNGVNFFRETSNKTGEKQLRLLQSIATFLFQCADFYDLSAEAFRDGFVDRDHPSCASDSPAMHCVTDAAATTGLRYDRRVIRRRTGEISPEHSLLDELIFEYKLPDGCQNLENAGRWGLTAFGQCPNPFRVSSATLFFVTGNREDETLRGAILRSIVSINNIPDTNSMVIAFREDAQLCRAAARDQLRLVRSVGRFLDAL